jgi:predicted PurR-regulated permease PerM
VAVDQLLGLEEGNETEVQHPDIEKTAHLLQDRRSVRSVALTGLFLLACFYTLFLAQEFFIPVMLAIVFNFLLGPFVRLLKRLAWIPEAAGALVVMLSGLVLVGLLVYELSVPIAQWITRAPQIAGKISTELRALKKPMERMNQATQQIGNLTSIESTPGKKPAQVELRGPGLADGLLTKTRDTVFGLVVLLVLLYFLLSSGDLFLRKLIHVLPKFEDKKRAVLIMREIEDHISRYLITVAMINAGLGVAAGTVFWLLGLPNPALWGALAFVLNFIPYIGSLTGIGIVAIVSLATFPNIGHALLAPACYFGIGILEGNFVSPFIMGRRMLLNPVVIFVGVTFWGFLWGILGVFLAVPMLVMLKIFCDHIEPLAPIGEFLGS